MNAICIILARAGSKGLPGKNALPVAGKPMLAWTIEHALESSRVKTVALSTDGEALAEIGRGYGIEIVNRPADLASDTATVDSAARHALAQVEARRAGRFEAVAILYGNVPVRPADLTDRALDRLVATGCDSVQSVSPVDKVHPYWMRKLVGDNGDRIEPYQPNEVYRRQDLPPVYMLNGGVIAVTRRSLGLVEPGRPHAFLGSDRRAVVTAVDDVVDVDSAIDRYVAEAVLLTRVGT